MDSILGLLRNAMLHQHTFALEGGQKFTQVLPKPYCIVCDWEDSSEIIYEHQGSGKFWTCESYDIFSQTKFQKFPNG